MSNNEKISNFTSVNNFQSGDVLTGMIGALLAQDMETVQATATAAYIHGRMAGELVVQILAGSDVRQLHYVSDQTGRLLFSRSGLLRWTIKLPDAMADQSYWTP